MPSRRSIWPFLFLAPFLAGFGAFFAYPLGRSLLMSFHRNAGTSDARFAGLDNYAFAVRDVLLYVSLANTLLFAALFLVVQVPASLGLALLLDGRRVLLRPVFRFVFFSTHLVGTVFAAVLFADLFSGRRSLASRVAVATGLSEAPVDLVNQTAWALPLMLLCAWYLSIGYGMIYCLAALQHVDGRLYDAATVDGAGAWGRFWHVTLPQVRPTLSFITIAGAVWALQMFELPYVLFDGPGPGYRGLTAVMYLFSVGFERGDLGYAAAVGWIFTGVVVVITAIMVGVLRVGREEVQTP